MQLRYEAGLFAGWERAKAEAAVEMLPQLWEEKVYYGVLNVGVRPTFSQTGIIRLEVNIFDFEGDLYGKEMKVQLLSRIRGEHKFDTIDELPNCSHNSGRASRKLVWATLNTRNTCILG